jgi:phosphoglycolate phosphatase
MHRALKLFLDFNKQHIADKTRLYPGIAETLHELNARGTKMAVISNKNEDLSSLILQKLGIHDLFESICGGDTYPERKPSPLPLLYEADKLGIAPYECVMAGDSINDILAGQQANIASIACRWGYGSDEELSGADAFAYTPQELLALVSAGLR